LRFFQPAGSIASFTPRICGCHPPFATTNARCSLAHCNPDSLEMFAFVGCAIETSYLLQEIVMHFRDGFRLSVYSRYSFCSIPEIANLPGSFLGG
jgi:hypothetical protein